MDPDRSWTKRTRRSQNLTGRGVEIRRIHASEMQVNDGVNLNTDDLTG